MNIQVSESALVDGNKTEKNAYKHISVHLLAFRFE